MGRIKTKFYCDLESTVDCWIKQGILDCQEGEAILHEYSYQDQREWLNYAEGAEAMAEQRSDDEPDPRY